MAQSLTDIKSDAITSVIANTISTINSTVSNVANNVTTLTSTVGNVAANVSNVQSTITTLVTPKISSITYPGDDTAAVPAGGQTITLTGTGFNSGASVLINGTYASVVSVVSSTSITFTAPAMAAGTYILYVINTDGGTSISIPGISYSGTPIWSTSAGTLGTIYETSSISSTLTATGDAPITYSLFSGTLPPGSSLDSSSGLLSGTSQGVASSTTYNFTIRATDGQNQDTDRAFSITLNPDVVTWNSPADGTSTALFQNQAMSNVTLSATSAAGKSITYSANALPTGVTITGAVVNGTPTTLGTTNSLITATAATTNKTSTRNFTWVVSVANDTYFKNVTLLLNGETTVTPFISDASTNSLALTIAGDTKPVLFNPYTPGYYSNYFDGTGDYLNIPYSSAFNFGTGDFTIECWVNISYVQYSGIISAMNSSLTSAMWLLGFSNTDRVMTFGMDGQGAAVCGADYTAYENKWTHIAASRSGTSLKLFFNGTQVQSVTNSTDFTGDAANPITIGRRYNNQTQYHMSGSISNLRVVKGTGLYTSAFTPSTTPLTAIANTSLLTCQSNRFIDNSTNNFTITKAGDTKISPNIPFTPNSSYSTYGSTYFDGTGDYLTVPQNAAFNLGTGAFTVESWVYFTALPSGGATAILNLGDGAVGGLLYTGWGLLHQADGIIRWYRYDGATETNYDSTSAAPLNSWNHIVVVRNGSSNLSIYINGVRVYTGTSSLSFNNVNSNPLYLGNWKSGNSPGTNRYLSGYISNARIVNGTAVYDPTSSTITVPTTPLTAIANTSLLTLQYNGIVNNSTFIDNSNFNNIITRNGNVSQGSFSPYSVTGWSTYFNGVNDYLTFSSVADPTGDFTIEFWWNPPNLAGSTYYEMFTKGVGLQIYYYNGMQVALSSSNSGTYFVQAGFGNVTPNLWNHIAVVRNGNSYTGYINGVGTSLATSSSAFTTGGAVTFIGSYSSGYYTPGYFSNVRYVVGTAVYTTNFTPPTTPLTAISGTRLLTCQSNRFIDNSPNNLPVTIGSAPKVQAFSPFGSISEATPLSYSTYFSGSATDLLTINQSVAFSTGDFTMECWVYPITTSTSGYITTMTGASTTQGVGIAYDCVYLGWTASYVETAWSSPPTTNTWSHLAVTRQGSTVRMFKNGALDNTFTNAQSVTGSKIQLGRRLTDYGAYYATAYISNARIVQGNALYTATFTPSTTPLTAVANTKLLTCQSSTMVDNSTNRYTITTETGSPKVYNFNPFGYTEQSAASYTPSLHGGSAYFDGTTDYLSTPNSSAFAFGTSNFTVEMWVYANSASTTHGLIGASTAGVYWSALIFSGTLYWQSQNGSVNLLTTSYAGYYDRWTHIAFVRNSGTTTLYLNGVSISSAADSTNYTLTAGTIDIGRDNDNGPAYMNGYLSDVRVTKGAALYTSNFVPPTQALTNYSNSIPASLLLNFNNGGIIDQHSSNVLETLGNAQLSTAVKKYNNASMYFDGASGLFSGVNIAVGTGDFTYETWVYPTVSSHLYPVVVLTASSLLHLFGLADAAAGSLSSLKTIFGASTRPGSSNSWFTAPAISQNVWTHLAFVRSGTTISIYVNGVSQTITTTNQTNTNRSETTNVSYIGRSALGEYLTGYLDDLRITKGVARYTSNFTAPTSAFITK